jgi:hypothetical protein
MKTLTIEQLAEKSWSELNKEYEEARKAKNKIFDSCLGRGKTATEKEIFKKHSDLYEAKKLKKDKEFLSTLF